MTFCTSMAIATEMPITHGLLPLFVAGSFKAHWCTGPGITGVTYQYKEYAPYPLLFNIERDPAESTPISTGDMPADAIHLQAMKRIMRAYALATFTPFATILHRLNPIAPTKVRESTLYTATVHESATVMGRDFSTFGQGVTAPDTP